MSARYDAIVIGGGVAGGTAAILLAQAGWSVALAEKRPFPRRKVCGECIAAPNLPLLEALGIGARFAAVAGPALTHVGLCVGDDMLHAELPRMRGTGSSWGRALSREQLDTLLLERAAQLGVAIRQPCAVRNVERNGSLYDCELLSKDGDLESVEAPVLISAHGSWERMPWLDHRAPAARASDLLAFKANFSGADLAPGLLSVLAFRGGYGGMVIADGGMLTLACCIRRDVLREWRAAAPAALAGDAVQRGLEATCRGVRLALAGARREGVWLSAGPVRPGIRTAWTEGSGFAVGNAAGEAHPILGEGISMAIQSSSLLCARLVLDRDALLGGVQQTPIARAYARDWRRQFAARVRWAAALAHIAMRPDSAGALLPLLRVAPSLLTIAARAGGKVRRLAERSSAVLFADSTKAATAPPRLGGRHS